MAACTDWQARSYEGGWHDWYTDFNKPSSDGYCHYTSNGITYAYCFYFKTPNVSNFLRSTSLNITIPVIRTSKGFAQSGTLYFKLLTYDPTGGSLNNDLKPSSTNCDASYTWNITDNEVHSVSFTINSTNLRPNTGYYITVGGSKILGIGYLEYTPAGGWWSANFNYETYTEGGQPSDITITQTAGSNIITFKGTVGGYGANNPIKNGEAVLWYTTNGNDPADANSGRSYFTLGTGNGESYTKTLDIGNIKNDCTIKAFVACNFTYGNSTYSPLAVKKVTYYSDGGTPSIFIQDNKNNTFSISGTLGKDGASNPMTSAKLYYTTNGSQPAGGTWYTKEVALTYGSGVEYGITKNIPDGCTTIWAVTYCNYTYGPSTNTGHQSKPVKYYGNPGAPGTPALENSSFRNGRLTIKQNWTYSWAGAAGGTNTSVAGYRLRLYKNGINIPIKNTNGTQLSKPSSSNSATDYVYDTNSTATSITIDPVIHGFMPGDTVALNIYTYAFRGDGAMLFDGGGKGPGTQSETREVENAGVVKVKVGNTWVEGQVYVKAGNTWHEAETVNVKVNGAWKESQ